MKTYKENHLNPVLTTDELLNYINQTCSDSDIDLIEDKLANNELYQAALEGALFMADTDDLTTQTLANLQNELAFRTGFSINQEPTYSLAELLAMFEPVEHYDALLAEVERSAAAPVSPPVHVLLPQNDINCYHTIVFELDRPTPTDLILIIENNQEDELIESVFPAHTQQYRQSLSGFAPGCYYWKLMLDEDNMLIGKFYVRKELMPL